MRVFLSLPSYDQRYWGNTLMSVLHCGPPRTRASVVLPNGSAPQDELVVDPISGSLLPRVFNEAFGRAVCRGFQRFVMLHSDIAAEPGWLTKLVTLQERADADVLSVVMPLKDDRQLSSTAVHVPGEQYRKLSVSECQHKCASVFDVHDPYLRQMQAQELLVNTGLMIMRLDRPWIKKWHGFQIRSRIVWQESACTVDTTGEDWDMSEQLNALGCSVKATTAIEAHHWGGRVWTNQAGPPPT